MLIRNDCSNDPPTPCRHYKPGYPRLPFTSAHIFVARDRQYEQRPRTKGELAHIMNSQVVHRCVAESRVPPIRKKRICFDRLVDAKYVLNAEQFYRQVQSNQHLVSGSTAIPVRRRHEVILQYELSFRSNWIVG